MHLGQNETVTRDTHRVPGGADHFKKAASAGKSDARKNVLRSGLCCTAGASFRATASICYPGARKSVDPDAV